MNNTTLLLILAGGGIAIWAIMRNRKPAAQPVINVQAAEAPERNLGGKLWDVGSDIAGRF